MNWYKIAQKKPETVNNLAGTNCTWIAPDRIIYDAGTSHMDWAEDNADFLEHEYGLSFFPWVDKDRGILNRGAVNRQLLRDNGWIRCMNGMSWEFSISTHNARSLATIGDELFKIDIDGREMIRIWAVQEGTLSEFYWGDFINSGISFVDYAKFNSGK